MRIAGGGTIPGVRRVGVDGVGDSPRLAALRDAVSLFDATERVGEETSACGDIIKLIFGPSQVFK